MSVIKDIQLNGSNLCNVECMDKNAPLHPETCADQVFTTHTGNITLTEWLSNNETDPEQPYGGFANYNSLHSWLEENYPINAETITLPIATTSTLGAIKVGQYLSVDNTGILSVDKESLNIPEIPDINIATISNAGIVKLGSNASISVALDGSDYQTTSGGMIFPLKLDSNSRAGIFIPNAYRKVSWSEIDDASDYVKNNTLTINYDGQAYEFTSNGSTDTNIVISSVSYTAGEGIDIDNGSIKQSAATNSSLGGIKIGYTNDSDTELKPVELDSNNKAYVNISNGSLKNHEVTAINQVAHDEHGNYFNTYTVRCNISSEDLTIVNINDFKQVGNGYTNVQNINTNDTYEWVINTAGSNNNIAIIQATSIAAKGYFRLIIDHGNNIVETHNVGFVIDTPPTYTFTWFSTCNWSISLYGGSNVGLNSCRAYLTVPEDFTGTIKITDIHLITNSGENLGSMNNTSYRKWINGDTFNDGSITNITGTQITGDFKIPTDSFITLSESPSVGDFLYDSEINDTLLHDLLTRVKSLELIVSGLINA